MKKITLLILLMVYSLGFSQEFPLTFTPPGQLFAGFGCATSLVPDPNDALNQTMQVVGGGEFYDNAQRSLTANINLANDANNTITFRVKPAADYGTRTHLLKFEAIGPGGGAATCELPFTTTGTAWQTISLNFGSGLGNYGLVVLFTDFANNDSGTYLFDDFAGATNIVPPVVATPSGPAPVPTLPAASVVSMYGESYPNTFQYSFGTATDVNLDTPPAINNALKINFAVAGFGAGYTETNVSTMQYVHFDYWTSDATTFNFVLINNSPVNEEVYTVSNPTLNTWVSVNIPLSYFTGIGFNPATWFQYKFDVFSVTPGTVYFDNIYFTSENVGAGTAVELPITFESAVVDYNFTNFGGAVSTKIPNPDASGINTSANVAQLTKGAPGTPSEGWGGSFLNLGTPIDFSTVTAMKMKVWSPQSGIIVKMKLENLAASLTTEVDVLTTTSNTWEELTFNFPGIVNANNYQRVVVFFDFGVPGTGQNYYFDDIRLDDGLATTSFDEASVKMYPNPTSNNLTINAKSSIEKVVLYNLLGQEVMSKTPQSNSVTLDLSTLQRGVYIVKTSSEGKTSSSRVIKN